MLHFSLLAAAMGLFVQQAAPPPVPAVTVPELLVEGEHPRLLLDARRARLLRREKERNSMRYTQLETLILGGAEMPEPGFAHALFYFASGSETHGRKAVEWALGPAQDLRQLALVFDWCFPLLSPEDSQRLAERIGQLLEATAGASDLPTLRSRSLAAIAIGGHVEGIEKKVLQPIVGQWWKKEVAPQLRSGAKALPYSDHYPLYEMMHALRDNFDIDLRDDAPKYFAELPAYHILCHYPAPYPAAENQYRIPVMSAHAEPDLRLAALSRAAGFVMVAYDSNAQLSQFLQGWLVLDRFLLRGTFGCPYEFLWANPYQPGLSYYYLPGGFHDPLTGRLLLRSSWDEDATWFYHAEGRIQMFRDGSVANLKQDALTEPIVLGATVVLPPQVTASGRFAIHTGGAAEYYLVGLRPNQVYEFEIDEEGLAEHRTDAGGILELKFPAARKASARFRPRP